MKTAVGVALAAGTIALALAVAALVASSGDDATGTETAAVRSEVASIGARLDRIDTDLKALPQRIEALESRLAALPSREPVGGAAIGEVVGREVRQHLLRAGVRVRVPPGDLPRAVRDATAGIVPGVEIERAEERMRHGLIEFRLRGLLADEEYDFRIAADGEIIEAEMPPERTPQAVRDAAARVIEGIVLAEAEQRNRDGRVVFDLEGEVGGEDCELRVSAGGEVLEAEMPASAAPEVVRAAALRAVEGILLEEAERDLDDGEVVYELRGRVGEDEYEVDVSAAGEVIEVEMPLSRAPEAVRDAALGAVPGIRLGDEVERKTRDGRVVYELEGEVGGEEYEITVSAEGELVEVEGPEGEDDAVDAPARPPVPVGEEERF
jgi:uncharacterized membrane protein YkoI